MPTKPLQIHLRPDQDAALRALAAREEASLADLVRRSVDLYRASLPVEDAPVMQLVGLGRSGQGDLSEHHDQVLARQTHR